MTYLDAAHTILKAAGKPLHFERDHAARSGEGPDPTVRLDPRRH